MEDEESILSVDDMVIPGRPINPPGQPINPPGQPEAEDPNRRTLSMALERMGRMNR